MGSPGGRAIGNSVKWNVDATDERSAADAGGIRAIRNVVAAKRSTRMTGTERRAGPTDGVGN
jgi:hypothetical protein